MVSKKDLDNLLQNQAHNLYIPNISEAIIICTMFILAFD